MILAVTVGTFIFIAIWIGSSAAINNYVQKDNLNLSQINTGQIFSNNKITKHPHFTAVM